MEREDAGFSSSDPATLAAKGLGELDLNGGMFNCQSKIHILGFTVQIIIRKEVHSRRHILNINCIVFNIYLAHMYCFQG